MVRALATCSAYELTTAAMSASNHEKAMRELDLTAMQFEELWQLYEKLTRLLADKVIEEKRELEDRLAKLSRLEIITEGRADQPSSSPTANAPRRNYPKVLPKYRNPQIPAETWSGRGKKPKWVIAALATGQRLDELKIDRGKKVPRNKRAGGPQS